MIIISFFLLLNIIICFNLDEYYRKQFTNETADPHLKLTNKTSDSDIPLIKFTENIPRNSTLLKINKNQILISCSKYPYDDLIFQYINQYFSIKRITSSFYTEVFNLLVKILYYKYAPLDEIEKEFKTLNISINEKYEYKLNSELMEYIEAIYAQLNYSKYNFDLSKYNKDLLKRFYLEDNLIASEVYDYILERIKLNKNEKIVDFLKSFLSNKKDEFIKLFNYLNSNGFSASYSQFEEFYLGIKNKTNHINYFCVYISPITDMLNTKINLKKGAFSFNAFPIKNQSLLLYTNSPINMKDHNNTLTKYFTVSNNNIFFQFNYLYDDYKKYNLKEYLYTKPIDIIFPKKIIESKGNKKLSTCQITNICRGLMSYDKNSFKMSNFISSTSENPNLLNFGRLLFMDEELLNESNKEKFELFIKSFSRGTKINDENELLAHLFYYEQLNREIIKYKDLFNDVINKGKEIEENKDLYRLVEINLKVVLANYNFMLDKIERILNHEIIDNL